MTAGGAFSEQSFAKRFQAMGDEAEGVFEAVYDQGFARYGLNRPPIYLGNVPERVRYTPDYLTQKGLVEVQGIGRDQVFKLKDDKYEALNWWHVEVFRVDLFVYDSANSRYGFMRLHDFIEAWEHDGTRGLFPEGKKYLALEASWLPVDEWKEYVHVTA